MQATQFHLITEWWFEAPRARVWSILEKTEDWPSWWRAVKKVEILSPGRSDGVGAVRRFTWRTALPYDIAFDMRVTRLEPMTMIAGQASGELDGEGIWTLADAPNGGAQVRYDWRVTVTKPWMITLAPVLRPIFAWNHGKVMQWGREGLQRRLKGAPH